MPDPLSDYVRERYDQLAEEYAKRVATKPYNAYYDRPATLSLLPDVSGKDVLDAGCGAGHYLQELIRLGARPTGLDFSRKMLLQCRTRVGMSIPLVQADLSEPLELVKANSFDVVVSPLVVSYIQDLSVPFGEFKRVLRPGGVLVLSTHHPLSDLKFSSTGNYFETEEITLDWHGFGEPITMKWYRRPLSGLLDPLAEAGFQLDRILEPKPTPEFKQKDPADYEKLLKEPGFICIRAQLVM